MSDLRMYHDLHNEIDGLKSEVEKLKQKLKCELRNKSKISVKYHNLKKRYVKSYRGHKDIAMGLIEQYHKVGDITLVQVAKKTKLAPSTIYGYSSEYLKKHVTS